MKFIFIKVLDSYTKSLLNNELPLHMQNSLNVFNKISRKPILQNTYQRSLFQLIKLEPKIS